MRVDVGGGDRLALAVLAQYRMAATEQMHLLTAPKLQADQTRRSLVKLQSEGLVNRIALPQAGRMRLWFPTPFGMQVASEWPELRGWRPPRLASDPVAARLRVGHALAVTETGLAFVQDTRRHGDTCQPLDWIPEVRCARRQRVTMACSSARSTPSGGHVSASALYSNATTAKF
ncbi:replication-relaxation family protein [Streptomyces sp. NPDC000983]|uniref:replication-relaxation family protein n=1 Tax=Streptomyces sp. NPDC000983 TaxID=3154373 RepID=UPI003321E6C7